MAPEIGAVQDSARCSAMKASILDELPGIGPALARATVRTMQWADGFAAGPSCGLIDLYVEPPHRGQGLATFLLSESFRILSTQGLAGIEVPRRAAALRVVLLELEHAITGGRVRPHQQLGGDRRAAPTIFGRLLRAPLLRRRLRPAPVAFSLRDQERYF